MYVKLISNNASENVKLKQNSPQGLHVLVTLCSPMIWLCSHIQKLLSLLHIIIPWTN